MCVCVCMGVPADACVFSTLNVCAWVYACERMGAGEIRGGENASERQR